METTSTRRQRMNHSDELLISYRVLRGATTTSGPIPDFLAKKQAEQAPKTYRWYHESLTQLWAFLEPQGLTTVAQFNERAVNLFRTHLRKRGVTDNTVSNRMRALRAFGRWLHRSGWVEHDPLENVKIPQSTKPHFDLIPDHVRSQLFALYSPNTFLGARNLAMLAVLSDTGLRREELVNVLEKNVDLDGQMVRVFSDKVEEWRYVPLTTESTALIRNYVKWRGRYFNRPARARVDGDENRREKVNRSITCQQLFVAWNGTALKPQSLMQILERASKKLGYRIHAHLFRHDWITRKALDGESPSVVRR